MRRAPRRARSSPLTTSRCRYAERRPRRVANPPASMARICRHRSRSRSRYGQARRTAASSASSLQSSAATMATTCCASTSSGCTGTCSVSSSPRRTASRIAAHSTSSSRVSGNSRPFGVPCTAWPERPARCRKVEMERVEPSWQTRSTSPMSIPSSSEAVATSTLRSPALSRCSAARRRSRERLPWCEVTCSSPSDSVSARATRSAMRRVLTNTSVVRCASMRVRSRRYTSAHTSPDITASSGDSGSSSARSRSLVWPVSTMVQVPGVPSSQPVRKWAMVSMGRWVADRPMRVTGRPVSASRRSSESARCAPRLLPATAWISSTITVPTFASMARPPSLVSRM